MNERNDFIAQMKASGKLPTWETIYDLNVAIACLRADLATAERELNRLRALWMAQGHKIEQVLGAALNYPRFCDDQDAFPGATEADGVCVGDHTPETLVEEAAATIEKYRADLVEANADRKRVYAITLPSENEARIRARLFESIAAVARMGEEGSARAMRIKEAFDELQTVRFVEARDKPEVSRG